jgi:hypothetical protein
MNLLTITCDKDFEEIIVQAKSIQKYVSSCRHWIFVNNSNIEKNIWIDSLTPFYTNHELKIFFTNDYMNFNDTEGWITQQIWKCFAIDWIQDDYIVLDSKNFFIKNVNLSEWNFEGSGYFTPLCVPTDSLPTISYYCNFYNLDIPYGFYSPMTPFIFRKKVIQEIRKILKDEIIFLKDIYPLNHSEFLLYNIFFNKLGLEFKHELNGGYTLTCNTYINNYKSSLLKPGIKSKFEDIRNVSNYYNLEMCGIHSSWYNNSTDYDRKMLNEWLNNLNINTPLMTKKILG